MNGSQPPDLPDDDAVDDGVTDAAIRRGLVDHVPMPSDPATSLRGLRPRFERARRRRQAATAALSSAAAIVIVAVGLSVVSGPDTEVITPADQGGSSTTAPPSTTTVPATTTAPTTASPAVAPTTVPGAPPASTPTATVVRPPAPGPTSTTAVPAPTVRTLTAPGGTVVVRYDAQSISIVSTTPADGWQEVETKAEPTRVEVRFELVAGSGQSRVLARIEDGQLRTDLS